MAVELLSNILPRGNQNNGLGSITARGLEDGVYILTSVYSSS